MSSVQSKTLDAVATVAAATPGVVFVKKGYSSEADGVNLYDLVATQTPYTQGRFYCWLKDSAFSPHHTRGFDILGELLVFIPKETDTNMESTWDFVNTLATNLQDFTQAAYAGTLVPDDVKPVLHNIDTLNTDGVAYFCFGAYREGHIKVLSS